MRACARARARAPGMQRVCSSGGGTHGQGAHAGCRARLSSASSRAHTRPPPLPPHPLCPAGTRARASSRSAQARCRRSATSAALAPTRAASSSHRRSCGEAAGWRPALAAAALVAAAARGRQARPRLHHPHASPHVVMRRPSTASTWARGWAHGCLGPLIIQSRRTVRFSAAGAGAGPCAAGDHAAAAVFRACSKRRARKRRCAGPTVASLEGGVG